MVCRLPCELGHTSAICEALLTGKYLPRTMMEKVLNDVLSFNRMESGKVRVHA
jgi:hypothetical protein